MCVFLSGEIIPCGALYLHIRSKPDKVIQAIVDTEGYIGICCIPRFLRRTGDIQALLDHIDYAVKKFGADHVAIWTDVVYPWFTESGTRQRTRFASLWPKDEFQTSLPMTQSLAWANWPLFTVGMVQRGHKDTDIQKILGKNVLRVAREALSV